ncbi:MAG: nitrilase-related carbon-nitrogen hydrolase [Candidatus Kapaibacterium sp.]
MRPSGFSFACTDSERVYFIHSLSYYLMSVLTLSTVQYAPIFGDTIANIQKIHHLIDAVSSDIIVFPELATTGYFFQNEAESSAVAEAFTGETIRGLQAVATERRQIIVLGFAEKSDAGNIYNSAALLMPDPAFSMVYRKTHLFYKERFCFAEGDTGFVVVRDPERDISIGVMICYDWRFPESARTLALQGADLIVCPSNLVTDVWHIAMPARALENKVYLAVANRTGSEHRGGEEVVFKGESAIWGYNGKLMAKSGIHDESILTVEIDPALTRNKNFNEFNNIFTDRRPDRYRL